MRLVDFIISCDTKTFFEILTYTGETFNGTWKQVLDIDGDIYPHICNCELGRLTAEGKNFIHVFGLAKDAE